MNLFLRQRFLAVIICLLFGKPTPALEVEKDPAQNAALQYWRAFQFESVPVPEGAQTNVYNLVDEAINGRFTPQAEAYFERVHRYLELMQRGARQPYCEWGAYPVLENRFVSWSAIVHLSKGRNLARIAAGRFRHLVHSGKSEEAVVLFGDVLQMAKHLDDATFLMGILLRQGSEAILINAAAQSLPELGEAALQDLARLLDERFLPVNHQLSETYRKDRKLGLAPLHAVLEAEEISAEDLEIINEFFQEQFGAQQRFSAPSDIKEFLEVMEKHHQLIEAVLDNRNLAEVEEGLAELMGVSEEGFGVGNNQVFLESALNIARRARGAENRLWMFRAALAVQLEGEGALEGFPEPYDGGNFNLEPQFRERFLLESNYQGRAGRTVRLQVGPKPDSVAGAAAKGDVDQVQYHLRSGALVERVDQEGWTPLHHAARQGRIEVVKLLLEHGAKVNQPVGRGASQYMMDPEMARRYGLRVDPAPEQEKVEPAEPGRQTALDLAREAGHDDLVELLKEHDGR